MADKFSKYERKSKDFDQYERQTSNQEDPGWFQPGSKSEAALRGFSNAATFGFGDEAQAFLRSLVPGNPGYTELRDEQRAANSRAMQENPWSFMGGSMVGALPQALGVGKAVNSVTGIIPKVAAAGTRGAMYGAAQGAGNAESVSDIPAEAAKEAAISGVLNAGLQAAAPVVAAPIKKVLGYKSAKTRELQKELDKKFEDQMSNWEREGKRIEELKNRTANIEKKKEFSTEQKKMWEKNAEDAAAARQDMPKTTMDILKDEQITKPGIDYSKPRASEVYPRKPAIPERSPLPVREMAEDLPGPGILGVPSSVALPVAAGAGYAAFRKLTNNDPTRYNWTNDPLSAGAEMGTDFLIGAGGLAVGRKALSTLGKEVNGFTVPDEPGAPIFPTFNKIRGWLSTSKSTESAGSPYGTPSRPTMSGDATPAMSADARAAAVRKQGMASETTPEGRATTNSENPIAKSNEPTQEQWDAMYAAREKKLEDLSKNPTVYPESGLSERMVNEKTGQILENAPPANVTRTPSTVKPWEVDQSMSKPGPRNQEKEVMEKYFNVQPSEVVQGLHEQGIDVSNFNQLMSDKAQRIIRSYGWSPESFNREVVPKLHGPVPGSRGYELQPENPIFDTNDLEKNWYGRKYTRNTPRLPTDTVSKPEYESFLNDLERSGYDVSNPSTYNNARVRELMNAYGINVNEFSDNFIRPNLTTPSGGSNNFDTLNNWLKGNR